MFEIQYFSGSLTSTKFGIVIFVVPWAANKSWAVKPTSFLPSNPPPRWFQSKRTGFISLINMLESYDLQTLIDDKLTSFIFYVDLFILIKCSDIILTISSLLIGFCSGAYSASWLSAEWLQAKQTRISFV